MSRKFACFILLLLASVPEVISSPYLPLAVASAYDHPGATAQELKRAMRWYEIAARQHSAEAALFLGTSYLTGYGVPPDAARAVRWLELAAADGEPRAENVLGNVFCKGVGGVPRNPVEANFWWARASIHGSSEARNNAVTQSCTPRRSGRPNGAHDI